MGYISPHGRVLNVSQIPASTTKSITVHFSAFATLTRFSMVMFCSPRSDQSDIIPVDIGTFSQFSLEGVLV